MATVLFIMLFIMLLVVFLAALGRSAIPKGERVPWRTWTLRDLAVNVVRGGRVLLEGNEWQRQLWDTYLNELQPWHRRHSDGVRKDGRDRC